MLGALCAIGSSCGANQLSSGYEFAIICLAASPFDRQANVAATPMQNVIRNRERAREARLRSDGCPFGNGSFSRVVGRTGGGSSRGSAGNKPAYSAEPRIVLILISPSCGLLGRKYSPARRKLSSGFSTYWAKEQTLCPDCNTLTIFCRK